MKIAVVSGDDVVGADAAQFCAALAGRGHAVTSYVRQHGRRRADRAMDTGYRVVSAPVGPGAAQSAAEILPFVGDWAAALERRWSVESPDVVHAFGWLGGLAAQLAARRQGRPTVQTFQGLAVLSQSAAAGSAVDDTARGRIEPLLARNAGWVTVESTSELEALAKLLHSRARVSVLTGGVDIDQYTPVGPALEGTNRHRILCVAHNPLHHNGFDTVIKALPRVRAAELVVAETDPTNRRHDQAREKLQRLAATLGVADRVRFLGTVPGAELPMVVRSADVLACTPREPPRAAAVLQAMASGVAVVGAPVGVLADIVVTDVTGLVLSADDHSELGATLRSLAAERFRCKGMGAAGRNRALSRYTWDRIALDSLAIYGKLSSERLLRGERGGEMEEVTR